MADFGIKCVEPFGSVSYARKRHEGNNTENKANSKIEERKKLKQVLHTCGII